MLFDDTAAENGDLQKTWGEENDPAEHFSAVSLSAILALAAGLLSLLYLISRSFLPLPLAALALAFFALFRIRRAEGRLTGGTMARAALTLALIAFTAVPIRGAIYRRELIRQGREFFSLVIDAAQKGDSVALSQLKKYQTSRAPVSDETAYWRNLLKDPIAAPEAVQLLGNDALLAIYNLGENAKITYRCTAEITRDEKHDSDSVYMIYAVTYSEHGEKKTFFIPFHGERARERQNGVALWRCSGYPKKPISLKGTPE